MVECHQWLEVLDSSNGILKKVQNEGRKYLKENNLPNKNNESWRLTDIKKIKRIFNLKINNEKNINQKNNYLNWPDSKKNVLRIMIGDKKDPLEEIELPKGISRLSEDELEKKINYSINKYSKNDNWQIHINNASNNNILALRVQGKTNPPIEFIMKTKEEMLNPSRIIILVEEESNLEFLQIALGSSKSVLSHNIELYIKENSNVEHGFISLGDEDSICLANLSVEQMKYSSYNLTSLQHGWNSSRFEPEIIQIEGRAKTILKGLQVSSRKEQIGTYSKVIFNGPSGELDQLQKAAAADNSHCIFNGAIQVPQQAQQTNASQLSRNLLLSNKAHIDTKPELEIVADDVRCAHGATVSQLQEEHLFYLRSRGVTAEQASYLLIEGYCKEILENLPFKEFPSEILEKIIP